MEPFVAKLVYFVGLWLANFVIRAPHIKVHRHVAIRSNWKNTADSALFVAVCISGFVIPLFYVFSPLLSFADYSIPLWVGVTGVIVLIFGDWVFWRSHKDLGGNWSPTLEIRENHRLVTEGIYQHIRHPMYSAIFLLMVAQAMILPNYVAGFSGIIPFAALYFLRVRKEERMMAGEFGEEYAQYCQRTGRLLPRLKSR